MSGAAGAQPAGADPLFGFVQLEFTHAIGPEPGSYVVAPAIAGTTVLLKAEAPGPQPRAAQLTGATRAVASTDVLLIGVTAGSVVGRIGPRRRRGGVVPDDPPAPAPITVATHVRATEPLAGAEAARLAVDRWRCDEVEQERVVDAALRVVNVAVRAHRVATGDPYTVEVAREDARAIRVGFGSGRDLRLGAWTEAHALDRRTPRLSRGELARAPTYVAAVLGGDRVPLDSEDLLLRALLDQAHGRERPAALQAASALELLLAELAASGRHDVRDMLREHSAAAERLRGWAVGEALDDDGYALLDGVIAAVERALASVRGLDG